MITLCFIFVIGLIFSILNLIAHCIVAAIQGLFEGLAAGLREKK